MSRAPESSGNGGAGSTRRGLLLVLLTGVFTKAGALASQLVFGWVFTEAQFALWAVVMTAATFVTVLGQTGPQKLLVQRFDEYDRLARPLMRIVLVVNTVSAFVLLAFLPLLEAGTDGEYETAQLLPLAAILAVAMVVGSAPPILRARLAAGMRFGAISRVVAGTAVARAGVGIAAALLIGHPVAFVLPQLAHVVWEFVCYRRLAPWPTGETALGARECLRYLASDLKWIGLGVFAMTFVQLGDYLALMFLADAETLGTYFFGFQLTVSLASLFTVAISEVMMPSYSLLNGDPARVGAAFERSVRTAALVAAPVCLAAFVLAPPAIHFVWQGRWDDAIVVTQLMALSLMTSVLLPFAIAALEATGRWRARTLLLCVEGLGLMGAAALGSFLGGLFAIAACVAVHRILSGMLLTALVGVHVGDRLRPILGAVLLPVAIALVLGAAHVLLLRVTGAPGSAVLPAIGAAVLGVAAYLAAVRALRPGDFHRVFGELGRQVRARVTR